MPIRFIAWNVDKFAETRAVNPNNRINKIVKLLNPAGGPAYDLFVLIEPRADTQNDFDEVATGAGPLGIHELLVKLRARPGGINWRVTTPVVIYDGSFAETMAMFYDGSKLMWRGPDSRAQADVGPPWDLIATRVGKKRWLDTSVAPPVFRREDLDGENASHFAVGSNPGGVVVDTTNKKIYWEESVLNEIWRCDWDGANSAQRVDAANAGTPAGLFVDPAGARIYWVNTTTNDIHSADLNGGGPAAIVDHAHAGQPREIKVGPAHMYWIDGIGNTICIADLDGANHAVAVAAVDAGQPTGLAVGAAKIYWVDAVSNDIKWADLNGGNPGSVVAAVDAGQPRGIVVAAAKIYWIDGATHDIKWADLNGGNPVTAVPAAQAGQPSGLRVDQAKEKITWADLPNHKIKWANLNGSNVETSRPVGDPADVVIKFADEFKDPRVTFQTTVPAPIDWRFYNSKESAPMLALFCELATGTDFYVLGVHAPKPQYGATKKNRGSQAAIAAIKTIDTVVNHPSAVIIAGDFNMCAHANPTASPKCTKNAADGHTADQVSVNNFNTGPLGYTLTLSGQRSSLRKGKAKWNKYLNHAYDHLITTGFAATANAGVIDLVAPVIAAWRANQIPVSAPGTPIPAGTFCSANIFYKIRVGSKVGISDHLPVRVDLTP